MGGKISGRTYDCLGEQLSGIYCMFGQGYMTAGLKTQSYTLTWLTEPSSKSYMYLKTF